MNKICVEGSQKSNSYINYKLASIILIHISNPIFPGYKKLTENYFLGICLCYSKFVIPLTDKT